jgi:hypothetical protein
MIRMQRMKQSYFAIAIVTLLSMVFVACGTEKAKFGELENIAVPTKEFAITANVDTTIFGPQGTRIFIEKGTFQFADGTPVTDSIQISLQEFYKKSDILLADLSTESNGKLLETAGMINITATSQGQAIEIKDDKRIVVHFPKPESRYEEMNLFYPAVNGGTDSSVTNWEIDTVSLVKATLDLSGWGYQWPGHDNSTEFEFTPKSFVDTGYYWNPVELYVNAFEFSKSTIEEVNNYADGSFGVEMRFDITTTGKVVNPRMSSKVTDGTRKELLTFLKSLPEFNPGKNNMGEIIQRVGILGVSGGEMIPLYKSREAYLRSFDRKYKSFENKPIKNVDDAELEYYVFSVANLGWINCDRFIEPNDPVDFIVKAPADNNTKVKLVFSDLNGVLRANVVDGNYVFSKVPKGTAATVFAVRNDAGNLLASFQKVTIDDTPFQGLALEAMTLAELKQELEKLN